MIPKIIHYCWFGGKPKTPLILKCIKSWKELLLDYEIMEWNESNFDLTLYPFAAESHQERKFAFTADICRLHVLNEFGGIYLDTDSEVVRAFDEDLLLNYPAFIGRESTGSVAAGVVGAVKGSDFIKDLLNTYKDRSFYTSDNSLNLITIVEVITSHLQINKGLVLDDSVQVLNGYCKILSREYFDPKDIDTRKLTHFTPNTIAIHHYDGSWIENVSTKRRLLNYFIGSNNSRKLIYYYKRLKGEY